MQRRNEMNEVNFCDFEFQRLAEQQSGTGGAAEWSRAELSRNELLQRCLPGDAN